MILQIINPPRIVLIGGLLLILAIYSMGWNGTLHYDDEANLDGLYGVEDWSSAVSFALQGHSGPTGRPLSLATFALQHQHWPNPKPFLVFNTVLHALNGLLCFLVLRRLLAWFMTDPRHTEWLAVFIALLWAASPFMASANLMVVQRMTGLSAFISLLFLWIYVGTREGYRANSPGANFALATIAGLGAVLAGLAKENGFLLPVFLLLIELLLVPAARPRLLPLHRGFLALVLITPTIAIIGYLTYRGLFPSGYEIRDYSVAERLLTQPRVLFDYIRQLLLPAPAAISPFHDSYRHSTGLLSPATTLLSIVGLAAIVFFAWLARRRWPLVAFGLLFFLSGHLTESTTVGLELYFPHRNYLPSLGLYLAIVFAVYQVAAGDSGRQRLAAGVGVMYLMLCSTVLGLGTSLWGKTDLAPEMWFKNDPQSLRAGLYLYKFYVENYSAHEADQFNETLLRYNADEPLLAIQGLNVCNPSKVVYLTKLDRAINTLKETPVITSNIADLIQRYTVIARSSDCMHLGLEQADKLIKAAKGNSSAFVPPSARVRLLFAEAQLADYNEEYGRAAKLLEYSMEVDPTLDAAHLIAYFHVKDGNPESAIAHLQAMVSNPPIGFPESLAWKNRLAPLLESLLPLLEQKVTQ